MTFWLQRSTTWDGERTSPQSQPGAPTDSRTARKHLRPLARGGGRPGCVSRRCVGTRLTCFERRVLDLVHCGVLVNERVDHVGALGEGVVDLHERLPLVGEGILG